MKGWDVTAQNRSILIRLFPLPHYFTPREWLLQQKHPSPPQGHNHTRGAEFVVCWKERQGVSLIRMGGREVSKSMNDGGAVGMEEDAEPHPEPNGEDGASLFICFVLLRQQNGQQSTKKPFHDQ